MDAFLTLDGLIALATLTAMEVVLGIDNVVFLAIVVGRLPDAQQPPARRLGLILALGIRIGLLFTISWVMGLTTPLLTALGHPVSGRDLILLGGGLFLIYKATWEIYDKLEAAHAERPAEARRGTFLRVLSEILLLDIVFSLDSVITAVGMANRLSVMVAAMALAMLVMLVSAGSVSAFVDRHPSVKILALAFLLLIGVMLVAEAMGTRVEKGYVYFAMAFSLFVEMLNLRYRKTRQPVGPPGDGGRPRRRAAADAMDTLDLGWEEEPSREDIRFLEDRLYEFNVEQTGFADGRGLACLVRDDRGQIVAGLSGWTWGGCGFIRNLWVHRDLRGRGYGSRLLSGAERAARARGCARMLLSTHSFQAPDFYRKRGYEVVGAIQDYPRGHTDYHLMKILGTDR